MRTVRTSLFEWQNIWAISKDLWLAVVDNNQCFIVGPDDEAIRLQVPTTAQENQGATAMTFLEGSTLEIAVGFQNGFIRLFTRNGVQSIAYRCHQAAVKRLDFHSIRGQRELWVLFQDDTIAILELEAEKIYVRDGRERQEIKLRKYILQGQSDVLAVFPCGPSRPTLFQSHARAGMRTLVAVGSDPIIGFYYAGSDQHSVIHLRHIATAIASRAAGAVWSFAKSWAWGVESDGSNEILSSSELDTSIETSDEIVSIPLSMASQLPENSRRRSRHSVLSPNGKLVAISDTLGRVLLVDTTSMMIVRLWKGYRDSQCGWIMDNHETKVSKDLYLTIYSARRGLVEVWRTRHGPKVFSAAVGSQAHLFTLYGNQNEVRCFIIQPDANGQGSNMLQVQPDAASKSIVLKYISQVMFNLNSRKLI